jgi:hypothetical protein
MEHIAMIRMVRAGILLLVAGLLAGCFKSDRSLIDDAHAAAPFARITYADASGGEKQVLTRDGKRYVIKADSGEVGTVRFTAAGDDLYVVEAGGKDRDGKTTFLYALLKLDPAKNTATAYKAIAGDLDTHLPGGIRDCGEGSDRTVCVDSLQAYVDYARAAMTLGAKPDTVWQYETE